MEDKWVIVHTPAGPHLWQLGDPTQEALEDDLARIRVVVGFPPGHAWMDGEDWRIAVTFGEPHRDLVARAKAHSVDELAAVPGADLAAYAAAETAAVEERQRADARAWWDGLDPAIRAELVTAGLPETAEAAARKKTDL